MREGWEEKSLGEVCYVLNGYAFKSKDSIEKSSTQLLRMGNLYKNILDLNRKPVFYPDIFSKKYKDFVLKEGDLIMSLTGTVDKTDYGYTVKVPMTEVDLLLNQRIMKIEVHNSKALDRDYLFKFLLSPMFLSKLYEIASGTRQANLSSRTILTLKILYPKSLQEQKQIVALLDQAFKTIDQAKANIEKNIENAKELFQSKLNDIFSQKGDGWEGKTLNEICEVKDGTHDSPKYVDAENGIPFVTQKNILDDGLSFENTKFITQEDHNDFYRRSNVAYNDILFAMIGANRGMACIVDDKRVFSIKNVGLIKTNKNYKSKFLLYYLKSPQAKNYVSNNSSGSAQGFIGLGKLRAFPVPFTSISNQNKIGIELDMLLQKLNNVESNYIQELNSMEELKKSILQKAFAGELTNKAVEV